MVESSYKNHLKKKRGISTIVGGIIFLVLLTAGFSTFFVAMDVQSDTMNAQRTISDSIIDKTQEQFTIAAATDTCFNQCKLGIQVKNNGPNPVQISNIWIVNKSLLDQPAKNIQINYSDAFIPPGYGLSILENQLLKMDAPAAPLIPDLYEIKVVSTIGTVKQTEISVGGNNYLQADLFTLPPDVAHNENVTVALRITNVGPTEITGVTPNALLVDGAEITIPSPHPWVNGVPELVTPLLVPADLEPSESTIFSWHTQLNAAGTFGDKMKFTNSASGIESSTGFGVSSNVASDKMTVRDPTGGGAGGSGEEIILKEDLFAKPGIFMTIPNTFGDDNEEAIWSVTVANPTDAPMIVTKLTVSVLFAGANDNQKIIEKPCTHTDLTPYQIPPITTDYWECPNQNQLVWYDKTSPFYTHTIPPRSAYSFLVTLLPGDMTGSTDGLDSVVLHASVFTTLGSFGETKWTSSMSKTTEAVVNAFMTDDTSAPYDDHTKVKADRLGIAPGSPEVFHIVLDDLNVSSQYIKAGAQLIINVPQEWVVTGPILGDFPGATVTVFDDTSSQIVGVLPADLAFGGKMITFTAIAPSPTCDKMYVMHVLANGQTNNDRPIGPVSEIVLQVDAPPPGPVCP
jgi:archaellum component FlaF (FlaF/FlaG flagellin family)